MVHARASVRFETELNIFLFSRPLYRNIFVESNVAQSAWLKKKVDDLRVAKENVIPKVWGKIQDYLTPEDLRAGKMEVIELTVTPELGKKLIGYMMKEKLVTWSQNKTHGRRVSWMYTRNFSVKEYEGRSYIAAGTPGSGTPPPFGPSEGPCMTREEIYFAVLKKYPIHLLDIKIEKKLDLDGDLFSVSSNLHRNK